MKIFSSEIIRKWDAFTIDKVYSGNSSELMEVAAMSIVAELQNHLFAQHYTIFCGTGNNGGDGLCVARLLADDEVEIQVIIAGDADKGSPDFQLNLKRLLDTDIPVKFISEAESDFEVPPSSSVIDCLFVTGINRPVEGWLAQLIDRINALPNHLTSVDVPSGLNPDLAEVQSGSIIRADKTLTFQTPKFAFFFQENYPYVGEFRVLPIGLSNAFMESQDSSRYYYEEVEALSEFVPRTKFAHKNSFGHARVICGSRGKIGAAVLSAGSAIRSGAGLVTASIPACGLTIMQTSLPEVMCEPDSGEYIVKSLSYDGSFSATAIGPGIGTAAETVEMLKNILKAADKPLVLDADALNIIASEKLLNDIPKNSILSPHVGEFDRLFGKHNNSFERYHTALEKAKELGLIIVLKGAHSITAVPDGKSYFNSSGNVGMATAGSGDSLTGILCSMLAQGYAPAVAARLAVFIHGVAGDLAAEQYGYEGMTSTDIISELPSAFEVFDVIPLSF